MSELKLTNPKEAVGASKVPLHLWPTTATVAGCMALLVDAQAAGKLNDDRQYPGGYRALLEQMTQQVERLKDVHVDRQPQHYTIANGDQA